MPKSDRKTDPVNGQTTSPNQEKKSNPLKKNRMKDFQLLGSSVIEGNSIPVIDSCPETVVQNHF